MAGEKSIRMGPTLNFDEHKEKDIYERVQQLSSSHKIGDFVAHLLRLAFESPEVYGDGNFGGILACYIKDFAKFSGADIEYVKYASLKKMNKDINNINLYFNYNTSLTNGSIVETNLSLFYDVYASSLNDTLIHSFNSLKDITLYVENNSLLQQNLSKIQGLKIETYEKDKLDKV